jgi:hypothetical protein
LDAAAERCFLTGSEQAQHLTMADPDRFGWLRGWVFGHRDSILTPQVMPDRLDVDPSTYPGARWALQFQ